MASRAEHEYVIELARTVNQIFANGKRDPNATEIATAHFGERPLGGEIAEGIRKRLHKIRDVLEQDYGRPVCLLSATYFSRFRIESVVTDADARRCLPLGYAMSAQGIYLPGGTNDLIWQAMVEVASNSGAAKVKRSYDRVLDAVEVGRLTQQRASELISGTRQRMIPDKAEIAAQIFAPQQATLEEAEV